MWIRITRQIKTRICGYTKFRDRYESMYGVLPSGRSKKKLKSIRHYLINDDERNARECYRQLEQELKEKSDLFK